MSGVGRARRDVESWPTKSSQGQPVKSPRATETLSVIVLLAALTLSGCADRLVTLRYNNPPAPATAFRTQLAIVQFRDGRGNEGDHGDPLRVGGIYGGYGNRNAKVMSTRPWPPIFHEALIAEFRAVGIDARLVDRALIDEKGAMLTGEVRNFSTESRWSKRAHISAVVQLRSADGRTVVNKEIKATESGGIGSFEGEPLEELLNRVLAAFVRKVATDADIQAALHGSR